MRTYRNAVCKLREAFSHFAPEGNVRECLDELAHVVAGLVGAGTCTILILDGNEADSAPSIPAAALVAPYVAVLDDDAGTRLVAAIVSGGKVVGTIDVVRAGGFDDEAHGLFGLLVPLVAKSVEVIQLQTIVKSRFTQLSLARSNELAIREMMTGVMQHPNQMARILARSFYREMLNAGFTLNQILFAATEVISELSASLRKRGIRQDKSVAAMERTAA
jgi:L-methionine (R)-S-oxide reductase